MGLWQHRGKRIGILICEDLWSENKLYTMNPAEELFKAHADLIVVPNASPSVVGKHSYRLNMVTNISRKYALPICYVNQVGGNDDIVFDGNSFMTDSKGTVTSHAKAFEEDVTDSFSINASSNTYFDSFIKNLGFNEFDNSRFFYDQAILGLKDYAQKCGFKTAVVGSSGGIDSAVVLTLATAALGAKNVTAITMPSQYSSVGSVNDSVKLCSNLNVTLEEIKIADIFANMLSDFNSVFTCEKTGVTEENMQARIRGMLLMAYSNRYGALLLTTGNKSELSVGYCTLYGDMCGGFNPIGGLYKTEVYALARFINRKNEIIPQAVIDKAPSAELAPGQRDDDSLPPYDVLDPMLKQIIEGDLSYYEMRQDWATEQKDPELYTKTYQRILSLIAKAEYKRRQGAICIKMHRKDFGFGRRMPIAQKWIG